MDEEQSNENPLINACACKGSVMQIHLDCLMKWIQSKLQVKINDNNICFNYKQFECEICKTAYPKSLKWRG